MAKSSGGVRGGVAKSTAERASSNIRSILADIAEKGYSSAKPFSIGKVDKEMKDYADEHGITLGSEEILMSVKQITHTLRESKTEKGKSVGAAHLADFPLRRSGMELYHDSSNGNFIYFDRVRNEKFVIHPNHIMRTKQGKQKKVNYITASKTDATEFRMSKYTSIRKRPKRNG